MAGFNPNRKKKTYSFNRSQTSQIVSASVNGNIEYFDATLVAVDSPFYVLDIPNSQGVPPPPPPPPLFGEYDENVIDFTWEDTKSVSLNLTFSSEPVVTLQVLPALGYENIIAFLGSVSSNSITVNLSAPHSGQIVYRAIYSAIYPTVVSRSVVSTSYFYTASAGYNDLINQDEVLTNYSLLTASTAPVNMFFTTRDINSNGDADVAIVDSSSFGLTSTAVSFSAPITNRVYYLAVK
jgi:hypothetical protein